MSEYITVSLQVNADDGLRDAQIEASTISLRQQLLSLDIESAKLQRRDTPAGALGEGFTLGSLIVTLLPAVLPNLIDLLKGWCLNRKGRKLVLEFKKGERSIKAEIDALKDVGEILAEMDNFFPETDIQIKE